MPQQRCVVFADMALGEYTTPIKKHGLTVHSIFDQKIRIVEDPLLDESRKEIGTARGIQVGDGFVVKADWLYDIATIQYVSYQNGPVIVTVNDDQAHAVEQIELVALPQAKVKYAATYYPRTAVIGFGGSPEGHIMEVCVFRRSGDN